MGRKRLRDEIVMWKAIDLAWSTVYQALKADEKIVPFIDKVQLAAKIAGSTVPKQQEITAGTSIQINVIMPEKAQNEQIKDARGGMVVELPTNATAG